ncbi:MAG: lipoprotein [Leeuwenhoekiella sp.]
MKKITLLLLTVLILSSCSAIDELTKFDIDYNSSVVVQSSSAVDLPFNVETPPMETNSESTFESNNTNKDLIEEIHLKSMKLTITDPADEDFSFLKSIEIFIKADGLDEVSIASLEEVPANAGSTLELDTSGTDIKAYIKQDSFTLRVSTVTDEVIDKDISIDILSVFAIDAKILGI